MKVFGHPIHLMLVHFPSALFPADLICYAIAYFTGDLLFYQTSLIVLTGGVVSGWLAAIAGLFDLIPLMKNKPGSMKKALVHGGVNTSVLLSFTILLFVIMKEHGRPSYDTPVLLIFKFVLVIMMILGNYIGGTLVLKDKVLDENTADPKH